MQKIIYSVFILLIISCGTTEKKHVVSPVDIDSITESYFPSSEVSKRCSTFKSGKIICEHFHDNGEMYKVEYYAEIGVLDSIVDLVLMETLIPSINASNESYIDGTDIEYYPSGKISRETEMSGGFMNGYDKWFYENGNLKRKGFYKNTELVGWEYWFHQNGQLYIKIDYLMKPKGNFNQRFVYDSTGTMIDSLTDGFVIDYIDDTISDTEPLIFHIELQSDRHHDLRILYNVDSNFNIINMDVLPLTETFRAEYAPALTTFLKGKNKLPIIVDHSANSEEDTITLRRHYGYLEFYVR